MKKLALLLIVLFVSFNLFAQKGISFQGIARDAQGNAITGETVTVIFEIGDFTETQNLTTDDFGVFSATIGSVKTTDFNNLVFANIDENLKVVVDGTTIYDDEFSTVPYAKAAENGVPVGSIMPFAGTKAKIPDGWFFCDGTAYSSTEYPRLYEVIGESWGNTGGDFQVPDLRGVFLRGINDSRTDDYADPDTRTVGSFQNDTIQSHNHNGATQGAGAHNHDNGSYKYLLKSDGLRTSGGQDNTSGEPNVKYKGEIKAVGDHSHPIDSDGGAETRPVNAGVNFIIKY